MSHELPQDLAELLVEIGAEVSPGRAIDYGTQYRVALDPNTANVNVYRTGKVHVQGKASPLKVTLQEWEDRRGAGTRSLASSSTGAEQLDETPRVGTDEAGKGDYFGPLVVAGVRVLGGASVRGLRGSGVRDSKTLSVRGATDLAPRIVEVAGPKNTCVVVLSPREYEACWRTAGSNVSGLLAEVNVRIFGEIGAGAGLFVVDEFGKSAASRIGPRLPAGVRLVVRPGGEDDVAVAAASVLARARYLMEMEALSEKVGFELPRGATHVAGAARRVVEERGFEGLAEVAKVHFATTERLFG